MSAWVLKWWGRAGQVAIEATGGGPVDVPPVEVYCAANELEAQVVKGRLESEGIPALLSYDATGPVLGLAVGTLAEVRVLVPATLAERAQEILAEDEGPYECDDCGAEAPTTNG